MGDIETLQQLKEILEIARNDMLRLYKYGLTPSDIRRLCTLDSKSQNKTPLTITPLSAGEFGSADLLDYKGKNYVRKSQAILISERLSSILEIPATYSPFRNEIKVLRELNAHPTLSQYVPVYYGHEERGDTGIYLMEYLKGGTLQDICEKRGLSDEEWDLIMTQIKTILIELHKAGYVFNDVHPGNFFICMNGNDIASVVLIDFGLTGVLNLERTRQYEVAKSLYNTSTNAAREQPFANRNIPAFNFDHLDIMKKVLEAPFQPRNGPAIPKCKRTPDKDFTIEFKPRDYDTANKLSDEQTKQLDGLNTQLLELQRRLSEMQAAVPKFTGQVARELAKGLGTLPPSFQYTTPSKYEPMAKATMNLGKSAFSGLKTAASLPVTLAKGAVSTVAAAPGELLYFLGTPFRATKGGRRRNKKKQKKTRKRRV